MDNRLYYARKQLATRLDYIGFFFFNDTATTEIYTVYNTLSLHDALPISRPAPSASRWRSARLAGCCARSEEHTSELQSLYTISYAVFCLKKKKKTITMNDIIFIRKQTSIDSETYIE